MSDGQNAGFRTDTLNYIADNFMTAVGISPIAAGTAAFNLHKHTVDNDVIIRLAKWEGGGDENPIQAYWVPQGESCLIPSVPGGGRIFVFTPDFSGCSIMVDQIDDANYRVYHVQGGSNYMESEYTNGPHDHGRGLAGSLMFSDYGTDDLPRAFAFLKYEDDSWHIFYQSQNGVGIGFANGQLVAIGRQTVRGGGTKNIESL